MLEGFSLQTVSEAQGHSRRQALYERMTFTFKTGSALNHVVSQDHVVAYVLCILSHNGRQPIRYGLSVVFRSIRFNNNVLQWPNYLVLGTGGAYRNNMIQPQRGIVRNL